MQKIIILNIFIFVSLNLLSQWKEKDNDTINATIGVKMEDWLYLLPDGTEMYCGLPNDDQGNTFKYYKILYRPDLLYCVRTNLIDSSFSMGYFKLDFDENENLCWKEDIYWIFFDKEKKMIRHFFYNQGYIVTPEEFKAVIK